MQRVMIIRNLFSPHPAAAEAEVFEALVAHAGFRLERIVSMGQATPPGEWLEQDDQEWVVLLTGSAGLRFEGEDQARELEPGDYVLIPSRRRHRVEWTDPTQPTVWLALHYRG